MIGQTLEVRRAIEAALSPLMGIRATGAASAATSGGYVELPSGSFAAPVLTSAGAVPGIARDRLVRTTTKVLVGPTATTVPIASHLGGAMANLASGTVIRWDPPITGMASTATVAATMTGGAASVMPVTVQQILGFDGIGGAQAAIEMFAAGARRPLPCIIVAWEGSSLEKNGQGRIAVLNRWSILVCSARRDGGLERGAEALNLLDACTWILQDIHTSYDGLKVSAPPASVTGRQVIRAGPGLDVQIVALAIETWQEAEAIDWSTYLGGAYLVGAAPDYWKRTRIDAYADETDRPELAAVVYDAEYDHEAGEFDAGAFDGGYA